MWSVWNRTEVFLTETKPTVPAVLPNCQPYPLGSTLSNGLFTVTTSVDTRKQPFLYGCRNTIKINVEAAKFQELVNKAGEARFPSWHGTDSKYWAEGGPSSAVPATAPGPHSGLTDRLRLLAPPAHSAKPQDLQVEMLRGACCELIEEVVGVAAALP